MQRVDIINKIGREFLISNYENDEFNYPKAFKENSLIFKPIYKTWKEDEKFETLDIRFVHNNITVLVETKSNIKTNHQKNLEQLKAYVSYEIRFTNNKFIAILASTETNTAEVYIEEEKSTKWKRINSNIVPFSEYEYIFNHKVNNKEKVMLNTIELNKKLHKYNIKENLRSQFVGTCLVALKNNLIYLNPDFEKDNIMLNIKNILKGLVKHNDNLDKVSKIALLNTNVLEKQDVRDLTLAQLREILRYIEDHILPYIEDKNTQGQDILSLFFTTFNKYVGKSDKNQAFTPEHICDFMSNVVSVNKHSVILDPCCGSGSFLVRAMTNATNDCSCEEEKERVKANQIYGIEFDEKAYGLATTNMLIHGDGNSNVALGNCFEFEEWISNAKPNVVLMNPPYNATRKFLPKEYTNTWDNETDEDPSKGLYFVKYILDILNKNNIQSTIAVLLPTSTTSETPNEIISDIRKAILEDNALLAVFSMPIDVFHPGANVTTCCMVFQSCKKHSVQGKTYFGYYREDGFKKKKNLGRVESINEKTGKSNWVDIKKVWLDLYRDKKEVDGLSVTRKVSYSDEWLAEAYMKSDFSQLSKTSFIYKIKDYSAFLCLTSEPNFINKPIPKLKVKFDVSKWDYFTVEEIFDDIVPVVGTTTEKMIPGNDIPYIAAKKNINGFKGFFSKKNLEYISKGNCIVFIQIGAGSAGYTTYQPKDFIGMKGKICCGYSSMLNQYNGLFLSTVLDLERPKYSFGRTWTGNKLSKTKVKLPTNQEGQIDWKYMENYIKCLPFGNRI